MALDDILVEVAVREVGRDAAGEDEEPVPQQAREGILCIRVAVDERIEERWSSGWGMWGKRRSCGRSVWPCVIHLY